MNKQPALKSHAQLSQSIGPLLDVQGESSMSASCSIDWEEADCVICGSSEQSSEATGYDHLYETCPDPFHVVKCSDCGHLYLSPRPSPKSIMVIYPEDYSSFTGRFSKVKYGGAKTIMARIKSLVMARRMNLLGEALRSGQSILDVGCGDGQLLLDIKEMYPHLKLFGLDWKFSDQVLGLFQRNGVDTIVGKLEDVEIGVERFDVVTMNQLIEHLWDPEPAMRKVFRAMRSGGLLSVETVNSLSYDRSWFRGGFWGGYYFPRHFNFFSHKSLRLFLERIGFRVKGHVNLVAPLHWTYTMHALTRSRGKLLKMVSSFFSDVNPLPLGFFTMVDFVAKTLGKTTSNQKMIAYKP